MLASPLPWRTVRRTIISIIAAAAESPFVNPKKLGEQFLRACVKNRAVRNFATKVMPAQSPRVLDKNWPLSSSITI